MDASGVYFVADVHIGALSDRNGDAERRFASFLKGLPDTATDLYMLGDIFDFRVEYEYVVPRGAIRAFGALAELADRGVKLHFVCGNHDYWVTDYLEDELGAEIIREPYSFIDIDGRRVCIGHGDGLGPRSFGERLIFKLFRSKVCIATLKLFHPWFVFSLARRWSAYSRAKHGGYVFVEGRDPLYLFAEEMCSREKVDVFIFGHLHTPVCTTLPCGAELHVLGDWSEKANYLNLFGMLISGRPLPKIDKYR